MLQLIDSKIRDGLLLILDLFTKVEKSFSWGKVYLVSHFVRYESSLKMHSLI